MSRLHCLLHAAIALPVAALLLAPAPASAALRLQSCNPTPACQPAPLSPYILAPPCGVVLPGVCGELPGRGLSISTAMPPPLVRGAAALAGAGNNPLAAAALAAALLPLGGATGGGTTAFGLAGLGGTGGSLSAGGLGFVGAGGGSLVGGGGGGGGSGGGGGGEGSGGGGGGPGPGGGADTPPGGGGGLVLLGEGPGGGGPRGGPLGDGPLGETPATHHNPGAGGAGTRFRRRRLSARISPASACGLRRGQGGRLGPAPPAAEGVPMLTLVGDSSRTCDGVSRRDFVHAGLLGLGGLTLPWLLRARATAAAAEPTYVRDRAVVLVFLAGGASHIETFNPNMDAPEPSRSVTGEVKTPLAGVTLGGTFPLLAKQAKRMAIVRSFRHPVGNHEQAISHVLTGGTDPKGQAKEGFSMGSMYARLRGANHPRLGLPTYHLLTAPHKDPQYNRELNRVAVGSRPGPLGAAYGPFLPAGKGAATDNLRLKVPAARLGDRRALLRQLDGLKRGLDERDTRDGLGQFEQQAVDLLLGGASKAFDLTRETKATFDRYDTSAYSCGKKVFEPSILGKQFLLARRLIESGAGFVTVQSAGWDMHADGNNPGIKAGMEMLGRPLDRALSAFLEDLEVRGLSDRVLVVLTGDFGRTPKINKNGGRDHWANLCTLALWGGGLKMGQVIGACDRTNAKPTTPPYSTGNLLATVMHYLFDVGTLRVARGAPGNLVKLVEDHRPIAELF